MCYLQPESPAEFGAKVYEMMSLALAGKSEGAIEEPSTGDAEVIEASEVITENDPWKSQDMAIHQQIAVLTSKKGGGVRQSELVS